MTQWGLDTIFNPGKRHMDEEKLRLQSTREEIGDSSGGRRIDLESGKVTIRRPGKHAREDAADGAGDSDGNDPAADQGAGEAGEQVAADHVAAAQVAADQVPADSAVDGDAADEDAAGRAS